MARNKTIGGRAKKPGAAAIPKRSAVPDRLDLRDRVYMPPVAVVPDLALDPKTNIPVLDQGQTNACTGFALASVVSSQDESRILTSVCTKLTTWLKSFLAVTSCSTFLNIKQLHSRLRTFG